MNKIWILLLLTLSLSTFAQDNERLLRNYRDYRERNENRFDWSKSKIFYYLKEYCNHDFSISNPELVEFIYACGLDAEQVAGRGMDGIYVNYSENLPDLPSSETNRSDEDEESDRISRLKKFNKIHNGLKTILQEEINLDETEETAVRVITIKELYRKILEEINYWPDMSDVSKDDIMIRHRWILSNKRLEQYEKDKDENQVKELELLFSKWQEITSAQLWEKQLLCENGEVLQSVNEIKDALRYKESNPLSPGVLVENGNRIPYKVIDGKLVVDGLCTLVYKDEQLPNATGDSYCYKKYTTNLKLVVKVVNGKAVSQTISGTQKWWDENKAVFKNTKGSLMAKAAAMANAKPVVVKTHNVTKIEDLGFGVELGIMHRNLKTVLGYASVEANSLNDLLQAYLRKPSPERLNRIKKPFMPVDVSALADR